MSTLSQRTLPALVAMLSLSAGAGAAKANVPEERVTHTLHVDAGHPVAADNNDGTKTAPFATIDAAAQAAAGLNRRGIGVRILIQPGTYRERVRLFGKGDETDAPTVFEAARPGETTISGSDIWTDWQRRQDSPLYTHEWPFDWGFEAIPKSWVGLVTVRPIVQRREMIFVDGQNLRQVLAAEDLKPGTFHVDEEADTVVVWPPEGVELEKATVEVAVRGGIFRVHDRQNMVIRGLRFVHDNLPVQDAAVRFADCAGVLVENCTFEWNNWHGFGLTRVENVVARNNVANHNGAAGMEAWKVKGLRFEDNDTSYNNWRGASGDFVGWAVAGLKHLNIHDGYYARHRSTHNQTRGFWFDIDCHNIVVEDSYWCDNLTNGVFIEANQGPIVIRNTVIARNQRGPGVITTNSRNITLENNIVHDNGVAQFRALGNVDRRVVNHRTGEAMIIKVTDWTLRNNIFSVGDAEQILIDVPGWDHLLESLTSSGNLFFHPETTNVFRIGESLMDLATWQSITGQDLNSKFGDPQLEVDDTGRLVPGKQSPVHARGGWKGRESGAAGLEALRDQKRQEIAANWADAYPAAVAANAAQWKTIDLRPHATRPLYGEDGWLGDIHMQLRHLPAGRNVIHGVPFEVIDQESNGTAAVTLKSLRLSEGAKGPLPEQVKVPLGMRAKKLYVLHGCGFAGEHGQVGQYELVYEDGTTARLPVVAFGSTSEHADVMANQSAASNIQDWWPTRTQFTADHARKVTVAAADDPLREVRYVYTLEWDNPHPQKSIRVLRLRSNVESGAALSILAITALQP